MELDPEVNAALLLHLQAIQDNDLDAYHATTHEDLTLYEWWVTPHRLDGLSFHDFMMEANQSRGAVFGADPNAAGRQTRFDLANLRIQRYGDTAIATYTLLISTAGTQGVRVAAHNETRVLVCFPKGWKVVHVHKSPAWPAPHLQP